MATVEYVMILALVGLGCAFAIVALGVPLSRAFHLEVAWLLLPLP